MSRSQRLAVEIGGTFTDIILLEKGKGANALTTLKVPSTPSAPERGVMNGVGDLAIDWPGLKEVLHGSTVATNAVLEHKGVPAALLVTEGFRDILEIQRGDKTNIYDIFYRRPEPVVRREWVMPIRERLSAQGEVLVPLDEDQVCTAARALIVGGIKAVAICFLHSYRNGDHEQRARRIIEEMAPGMLVLASSELLPQFREYERASTAAMSAYISPIMTSYVNRLTEMMRERGFGGRLFITQSNGGVLPSEAIRREVVRTLLSGPAAGVTGAIYAATQVGFKDIITFDMGGTSTDVCLINDGEPLVTTDNQLNNLPVAVPMIDIVTVGAGGGSIASVDRYGMLHVGPESAGADPGPACYGKGGTKACVSDADVARGIIRAKGFADGKFSLDGEAADNALTELGNNLAMSSGEAAEAIARIVEANMTQAIRLVSTQRGHDPRKYTLVAYGGAGPVHAASVADELGMTSVLVPSVAGVLSAFGLLVADISRDYVQTDIVLAADLDPEGFRARVGQLADRARSEFEELGFDPADLVLFPSCDLRYEGQAFELPVSLDLATVSAEEVSRRFHAAHKRRYAYAFDGQSVEVVNFRLKAVIPRKPDQFAATATVAAGEARGERGTMLHNGQTVPVTFYTFESLPSGSRVVGPAVLEANTFTCLVPENWSARLLEGGSVLLEKARVQ